MNYKELFQNIINGEVILFLGAGFSFGAKNNLRNSNDFKTGIQLANRLIPEEENLNIAASMFIQQYDDKSEGVEKLISILKEELVCSKYEDYHKSIIGLPWKRIYTTNYDDIVEKISLDLGIKRESISITSEMNPKDIKNSIIHINGDITKVNVDNFDSEFIITYENYRKEGFLDTDWKELFIEDLQNCVSFVFIGYSLEYDFSLQTLIYNELKDKCLFIDKPTKTEDISKRTDFIFKTYGEVAYIGTNGLAEKLSVYKETVLPTIDVNALTSFEQITSDTYKTHIISGREAFDFYILGKFKRSYINSSTQLLSKREDDIKKVKRLLGESDIKIGLVHSYLGNGKSVFLECLGNNLYKNNSVYFLRSNKNIYDELSKIDIANKDNSSYIILIDNIGRHLDVISLIKKRKLVKARIIGTVRTPLLDNIRHQIVHRIGYDYDQVDDLNINKISDYDLEGIYNGICNFNYWGMYSNYEKKKQLSLLKKDFKAHLCEITYFILESDGVKEKIEDCLEEVKKNDILLNFLVSQSIASSLGLEIEQYELISMMNIKPRILNTLLKNPKVHEIFSVNGDYIKINSAVFSSYIIEYFDKEKVIDVLITMFTNSTNLNDNERVSELQKDLVSRSNLKLLVNKYSDENNEVEEIYERFYDRIQNVSSAKNNHFFWLHFGITVLNMNQLARAKKYFENSYSIIEKNERLNTSHIDTHYPRLLFTILEQTPISEKFDFSIFEKAHYKLINSGNSGSNLKYTLRNMNFYYSIYEKHIVNSVDMSIILKYNQMLKQFVDIIIEYFENSYNEGYQVDFHIRNKVDELIPFFETKLKQSDYKNLRSAIS